MPENTPNTKQTEQARAQFAYGKVEHLKKTVSKDTWDEYVSGVKKLPILIKTNGLAQALAFIIQRNTGFQHIYEQVMDWLVANNFIKKQPNQKHAELIKPIIQQDSAAYRYLTAEVLTLLNWMKRFADGLDDKK